MKKPSTRIARSGLLAMALVVALLNVHPVFAEFKEVTGDFAGKTMCEGGMKKAAFKDPNTQRVTYFTYNEISHRVQSLSWPEPDNPMSFDEREKMKIGLQHVLKVLREFSCDTQDKAAQSTGLQSGTQNGTQNGGQQGTKTNSYVQSPLPPQ